MSLNNEQCKTRLFLIDLNPVKFKYCPFMTRWFLMTYLQKCLLRIKQKVFIKVNVKAFNIIEKMKLKHWSNIFHVILNTIAMLQHVIPIKNGIMKHVNMRLKIVISTVKEDYN